MKISPALRAKLKEPFGFIVDSPESISKDAVLACVGDLASTRLLDAGYEPKLVVFDGYTKRKKIGVSDAINAYDVAQYHIKNPQGCLKNEVFNLFRQLLNQPKPSKVYVDGEEDLTAIAAIDSMPLGGVVVYGQPGEGLVVVDVDEKIKEKIKLILLEMENGN